MFPMLYPELVIDALNQFIQPQSNRQICPDQDLQDVLGEKSLEEFFNFSDSQKIHPLFPGERRTIPMVIVNHYKTVGAVLKSTSWYGQQLPKTVNDLIQSCYGVATIDV